MKSVNVVLAASLLSVLVGAARAQSVNPGIEVVSNADKSLSIYGRGQMIGVVQNVPDPFRDHNRLYLFMRQARVGMKGKIGDTKFDTQFAFGGESANGSNTDLSLLDMVADVPLKFAGDDTWFKIGQFRVPYSREGLTDRGFMSFAERSVGNLGSYQARDYGLAVLATKGVWTGTIGTFSSGGRDVPQRYLPERLGLPYTAARFGYNDGYDDDIYHVMGTDINLKRTTKAVMLNGLYMQDTLIGHSSALQSRTIDKNLLMDAGFNPYINQGGPTAANPATQPLGTIAGTGTMHRGNLWYLGADAGIRHPIGPGKAVSGEVEVNWGGYQNRFGALHMVNWRAQGAYQVMPFEFGLRYGALSMDSKSGFLTTSATGTGSAAGGTVNRRINNELGVVIHEIDPSITWHYKGHNIKVVADLPIFLNCPLWYDRMGNVPAGAPNGSQPVGVYAFPDPTSTTQNSLLATPGNMTRRRTVVEARMMFQFMF
jgi:hypothetical protein